MLYAAGAAGVLIPRIWDLDEIYMIGEKTPEIKKFLKEKTLWIMVDECMQRKYNVKCEQKFCQEII